MVESAMTAASEIFRLWGEREKFSLERIVVDCASQTVFQRAGFELWKHVKDQDDSGSQAFLDSLYRLLKEIERTPIVFDESLLAKVANVGGGSARVRMRWGDAASGAFDKMLATMEALCVAGSALRSAIESRMSHEQNVAIYCHRSDGPSFDELMPPGATFLLTPAEYRKAKIVGALVKVGGMRRKSIGRIPESVLLAPRQPRLVQFMWSSDKNEDGFGDCTEVLGFHVTECWRLEESHVSCGHKNCIYSEADFPSDTFEEMEEWSVSRNPPGGDITNPVVLKFADGRGVILRRGAHEMVYEVESRGAAMKRADDIVEGDLLLTYEGSIDFGPRSALSNPLVDRWRTDLRQALDLDRFALLSRLHANGVKLLTLEHAINAWCKDRRPQAIQTLVNVCLTLGWTEKDAKRLWKLFSIHHSQAVVDGSVENDLERESIVAEINKLNPDLFCASPEMVAQHRVAMQLDIDVGEERLKVTALPVDETHRFDAVEASKLNRVLDWQELFQ